MLTQQLVKTPILKNKYKISKPKLVVNNNDSSSIKKSLVAPVSTMKDSF